MKTYRPHPVALIFPELGKADLKALADDIKAHGQRDPIVVMGDVLLDGRNRLAACELAGVKPRFEEWEPTEDDTPEAWIISHNLHRRHLDESQRSMAASDYADYLRKERGEQDTDSEGDDEDANLRPEPQQEAASAFNVSRRSVQSADTVKREAEPELVKAVREGRAKVSAAAKASEAQPGKQRAAAAKGKRAVAKLAQAAGSRSAQARALREKQAAEAEASPEDGKLAARQQKQWRRICDDVRRLSKTLHALSFPVIRESGSIDEKLLDAIIAAGKPVHKMDWTPAFKRTAKALAVIVEKL